MASLLKGCQIVKKYIRIIVFIILLLLATGCSSVSEEIDIYKITDQLPEDLPLTVEEIVNYPEGSYSGKSHKDEMKQIIEIIKRNLPPH